jgi:hypothetical protein
LLASADRSAVFAPSVLVFCGNRFFRLKSWQAAIIISQLSRRFLEPDAPRSLSWLPARLIPFVPQGRLHLVHLWLDMTAIAPQALRKLVNQDSRLDKTMQ